MDQRLYDAARTGDVDALDALRNAYPLILNKICLSHFAETPLHVATLAGQTKFAKEIITLMPSFARELNRDGFAPMHVASARGDVEIVMELLKLDTDCSLCLQRDNSGQIPLHYAVIRGRIPVIEKLINHCSESLQEVTALGETVLHIAVKNSQFEALKVVLERLKGLECFEMLLSRKDNQGKGKTLVELAEATKQVQVLELLQRYDAWAKSPGNHRIMKSPADNQADQHPIDISSKLETDDTQESKKEGEKKSNKIDRDNLVLVAAVLIATVTYQALLTPPPSVWKEGINLNAKCLFKRLVPNWNNYHVLCRDCPADLYYTFMVLNTAGFLSSVIVIERITLSYDIFALHILSVAIFLLLINYGVLMMGIAPDATSQIVLIFAPYGVVFILFWIVVLMRKATDKFKKPILKWLESNTNMKRLMDARLAALKETD